MEKYTIRQGIDKILAYDPDQAREANGVGFNAPDGVHVRELLPFPEWTGAQEYQMWETLRRYRSQLMSLYGIDFDTQIIIPEKIKITDEKILGNQQHIRNIYSTVKEVTFNSSTKMIEVKFNYNSYLVTAIKKVSGMKFDWNKKSWEGVITPLNKEAFVTFCKECQFIMPENLREFVEKKEDPAIPQEPVHPNYFTLNPNGRLAIVFEYDPKKVDAVKQIPGRTWDGVAKRWIVELSEVTIESILKFKTQFDIYATQDIEELLESYRLKAEKRIQLHQENIEKSQAFDSTLEVTGLKGTLRPFQKAGIEYSAKNKKVIIGDEMGLGKTIQAIGTIHYTNAYPCLIVVPNSLKFNWRNECEKWVSKRVKILHADSKIEEVLTSDVDILITNYNTVTKYEVQLKAFPWKGAILDESHYVKNPKAKRTVSVRHIIKGKGSKVEVALLLTGTAVVNRPLELTSQLDIIGKLDSEFGGFWKFANRYCDAKREQFGWNFNGASNIEELHEKLRRVCYVRRDKKQVLTELPEKQRAGVYLEIDNRAEYRQAERDLIAYLKGEEVSTEQLREYVKEINRRREGTEKPPIQFDELTEEQLSALRKDYVAKKVNAAEAAEHLVRVNKLKKLTAEGKFQSVVDWIEDFLESGEKLVVFAHHQDIIKRLADHFKADYITGDVDVETRQGYVERFQNDPRSRVLFLNLKAGGVGLTLTAASNVAFVELGWTPSDMSQAEDRIHRIGQRNSVTAWYLMGENTIDNDIFELIEEKRKVTDGVNAGVVDNTEFKMMNALVGRLLARN